MGKCAKEFQEKEYFKEQIIVIVRGIENLDILEYIYKMTVDISKEDK